MRYLWKQSGLARLPLEYRLILAGALIVLGLVIGDLAALDVPW
jgi:hypothetical protein